MLRFSAFNQRTTPELNGEVSRVSADITQDQKTGASFYTVRIAVAEHELARLNGLKLVPGMPVESFIQTGERTVISVSDQTSSRPTHESLAGAIVNFGLKQLSIHWSYSTIRPLKLARCRALYAGVMCLRAVSERS